MDLAAEMTEHDVVRPDGYRLGSVHRNRPSLNKLIPAAVRIPTPRRVWRTKLGSNRPGSAICPTGYGLPRNVPPSLLPKAVFRYRRTVETLFCSRLFCGPLGL